MTTLTKDQEDDALAERTSDADAEGREGSMTFLQHLDELRKRLFRAVGAILLGFIACYAFSDQILAFLLDPIEQAMGQLAVIRPAEAFMNKVKAGFVGGLFLSLPVVIYQVWAFVAPGLYKHEKRWFIPVITAGSILFMGGAAFCYWVAMPAAVNFLAEQGKQFQSQITVDYAFAFSTKLLLGLGVVFELPLVIFAMARLGVVTPRFLFKRIDVATFICFLVAAIITPTPDVMTMSLFALPMVGLYIFSIGVAWLAYPRRKKKDEEQGEESEAG